jgi:hypothetical protein
MFIDMFKHLKKKRKVGKRKEETSSYLAVNVD